MINSTYLEEKYGKEEVREAKKKLKGLTWYGNEEDMIESLIKQKRTTTYIPLG